MTTQDSENKFQRGLSALIDGRPREAARRFDEAIEAQRQQNGVAVDVRYLSYYGLSLARCGGKLAEAVRCCELAVDRDGTNPVLYLNLGRAYVIAGQTGKAIRAFEGGLRQAPGHRALRVELARTDRRVRPAIPELDRSHPVNIWLGKVRNCLTRPREIGRGPSAV